MPPPAVARHRRSTPWPPATYHTATAGTATTMSTLPPTHGHLTPLIAATGWSPVGSPNGQLAPPYHARLARRPPHTTGPPHHYHCSTSLLRPLSYHIIINIAVVGTLAKNAGERAITRDDIEYRHYYHVGEGGWSLLLLSIRHIEGITPRRTPRRRVVVTLLSAIAGRH